MEGGNIERAKKRMNDGDGGLAKHANSCTHEIDWENAKIINKEQRWTQRKYLEGIETIKLKDKGIITLNSYNQMEQWQSTIYSNSNWK